jgi:(E)-2-((N-methylformamido)methylene)succinate hydrolase
MSEFKTSWGSTRYSDEGSGPCILLIHGVGARLENWDYVATLLSTGFRVVRYDLRGHGGTSKVPGPYSLDMFAEDAVALLDHLGVARAHVAGHSLGGMIATTLAAKHPERVERLAVLSSAAGRSDEERKKVMERTALIASGIPGDHFRNSLSRWFTDEFRAANPALMEQYAARNKENDPACYAAAYTVLANSEIAPELLRIKAPTLVITGEQDLGSSPRMARFIQAGIAGSELRILPRLRHSILVEAPKVVAALLEPFFRGNPVPSLD